MAATKGRQARSVPVPTFVLDALAVQCEGKGPTDLAFTGRDGGYLPRPKSTGGWFAGAVGRAGVQAITPHDLRHTCANLAMSAGVNVLAPQRMLGHKSPKVTLDTYADLFDAIEYNAMFTASINFNARAVQWARRHRKPLVGNGDVHRLRQLGTTYSLVDAANTPDAICEAIRHHRVQVVAAPLPMPTAAGLIASIFGANLRASAAHSHSGTESPARV